MHAGTCIHAHNENLQTRRIKRLLLQKVAALSIPVTALRILLMAALGESYAVSLLMADAVLRREGTDCVELGAQLDVGKIVLAAKQFEIDIIALSVSDPFPVREISVFLNQLP